MPDTTEFEKEKKLLDQQLAVRYEETERCRNEVISRIDEKMVRSLRLIF